jgi:hypothetical protein
MDSAFVSASFGLIGAIVGGLTSFSSTWLSQHAQIKAKFHEAEKARRHRLFSEFIAEASRLYGDALTHEKDDVTDLVSLYALIANMRLATSIDVVNAAENAMKTIIDTYLAPNRTLREIGVLARDGRMNFLYDFGEVCRVELAKVLR